MAESNNGDANDDDLRDPYSVDWRITRDGRAWDGDEAWRRLELTPEKLEMSEGKLLWSDAERLLLVGLLVENVGVDRIVRLGDPHVWRQAIDQISESA